MFSSFRIVVFPFIPPFISFSLYLQSTHPSPLPFHPLNSYLPLINSVRSSPCFLIALPSPPSSFLFLFHFLTVLTVGSLFVSHVTLSHLYFSYFSIFHGLSLPFLTSLLHPSSSSSFYAPHPSLQVPPHHSPASHLPVPPINYQAIFPVAGNKFSTPNTRPP